MTDDVFADVKNVHNMNLALMATVHINPANDAGSFVSSIMETDGILKT